MGVRFSIDGESKDLFFGTQSFQIDKDLPVPPDWWPKPYEFESFAIIARSWNGAIINYHWRVGSTGGEGDDFYSDDKKMKVDIKPGQRLQIGSITFEGY